MLKNKEHWRTNSKPVALVLPDTICSFDIHSDSGPQESVMLILVLNSFLEDLRVVPMVQNRMDHTAFMHSQHTIPDLSYAADCT